MILGVTIAFVGVDVMSPVIFSVPFGVIVGVAVPALLLKTRPASVLLPTNARVDAPLSVTMLLEPICPSLATIVTLAPLITRPSAGFTAFGMTTEPASPFR